MIKYSDLMEYTKEHHVRWDTDLFDVLRGFFQEYLQPLPTPSDLPIQQEIVFPQEEFTKPEDGEYSTENVLKLFSQ